MGPTRRLLLTVAVVTLLALSFLTNRNRSSWPDKKHNDINAAATSHFPRKIWQTWREPAQGLEEELQRFTKTWIELNPDYRYELLTDQSSLTYVKENFRNRQDIIATFKETDIRTFRADFIRYLVLFTEGGVYTDIDTHCTRPIDDWIPPEYMDSANLIVGLEFDARGGGIPIDIALPLRLSQWTLVAKPGSAALKHVVDRVAESLNGWNNAKRVGDTLKYWREGSPATVLPTSREVLDITGKAMFTRAVFEYLSWRERRNVLSEEVSNIKEPKLIGDVLFLPISAFASGQAHSGSKPWDNDEQLISHHWRGAWQKDIS